jgi:hypothetical protein
MISPYHGALNISIALVSGIALIFCYATKIEFNYTLCVPDFYGYTSAESFCAMNKQNKHMNTGVAAKSHKYWGFIIHVGYSYLRVKLTEDGL